MCPGQVAKMHVLDVQSARMYCVFRRGTSWFAVPALAVREVLFRPAIAHVPNTSPLLSGLCHVRTEFLPVLNLGPLLGGDASAQGDATQLLVISSDERTWGLLVDQVVALNSLETYVSAERDSNSWFAAVLGWARYQDQVLRVLDPSAYYRVAETALEQEWAAAHDEYDEAVPPTGVRTRARANESTPAVQRALSPIQPSSMGECRRSGSLPERLSDSVAIGDSEFRFGPDQLQLNQC